MNKTLLLGLLISAAAAHASAQDLVYKPVVRTFYNPTLSDGKRVDWCAEFGTHCGKPAADEYCAYMGFDSSVASQIAYDIGHTELLDGERCDAPYCDGFSYIQCVLFPQSTFEW